jgi:hypothetical protein
MLFNVTTGRGGIRKRSNAEIVIMVSSLHELRKRNIPFLFTDRHAYLAAARFFSDLARLDQIDWPILQRRDFKSDPEDPSKMERYQAEALVHKHLPIDALLGLVSYNDQVAANLSEALAQRHMSIKFIKKSDWYF